MKKQFLFLTILFSALVANAQSYVGFYHDNYAGVQSVLFNPASIADSRFKTDINLISLSASVNNDAYGVKLSDVLKKGYDFDLQSNKAFTTHNNATMNIDVMGPAFMFNIAPKHSLAVYTRARAFVNVIDVNGSVINEISKSNSNSFPTSTFGSPNAVGNSWGEFGVSYAAVLYQQGQHFLKGGITAKYLQGVANYHFQGNNVTIKYDENALLPQNSTYTTTGTAVYGSSQDFSTNSDVKIDSNSKGYGADLGLIYEWRPDFDASRKDINDLKYLNKYKIRFGVSVTDLGSMKYDKGIRNKYDLNKVVTQNDFDNADNFDEFIKNNYTHTIENSAVESKLPTAVHADIDWNMYKKFYLNLNGDMSVVNKSKLNQNSIANALSLTLRYESKWFSLCMPVTYLAYNKQTQVGVGLRTGMFFIGSGSALSNVISNNSKGADVYLGVKIPVYQKKLKDQDEDGVLDQDDACPTVAGSAENKGCPWADADNDGVLDKDDKCPSVAGPLENNGCPWGDADKDSILDNVDACPSVAGSAENKGCPWGDADKDSVLDNVDACPSVAGPAANKGCPWSDTDGDSVLDKDDKCPTIKGTVKNNGCPEVDKVVLKKLNDFSKSILFESGKSIIKQESSTNLDEIVKVMNEYGAANFKLEGYTDNTGNAAKNLQLSKNRATAVKDYLISKGISSARLSSEGYGITKPIASNKTVAGRALNRRVEIILMK